MQKLIEQLGAADLATRRQSAEELAVSIENPAFAAVMLCRAVADDDEVLREYATAALENIVAPLDKDLQSLAQLLSEAKTDTMYWAATLIGRAGEAASTIVSDLINALQQTDNPQVLARVIWALGKIGPAAEPALPTLKTLSNSDHPRVARSATQAIQKIST